MKKWFKNLGVMLLGAVLLCNAACFKIPANVLQNIIASEEKSEEAVLDGNTIIRYIPDSKPELKDDFYAYVNYDVLSTVNPYTGNGAWNAIADIDTGISISLYREYLELEQNQGNYPKGTPEQRIADFSTLISDYEGRNAESINEIKKVLKDVEDASNLKEYLDAAGYLFTYYGFSSVIYFDISPDAVDSMKNTCWWGRSDIVLDREVFTDPDMENYRNLYKKYMVDMFVAYGYSEEEASQKAEGVYEMQKTIAENGLSTAEAHKPENYYNPCTRNDLFTLLSGVDVDYIFQAFGLGRVTECVVSDKGAVSKIGEYLREENLQLLKDYTTFIFLNDTSEIGTIEMRNIAIQYQVDYYGGSGFPQDEDIDINFLLDHMVWDWGKIFVEKHVSEEMKKDVENMTYEIIDVYKKRIDKQDWMSDETKAKAKKKLDTMSVKIGYPDQWPEDMDRFEVIPASEGGLLIRNYLELLHVGMIGFADKLDEPVDREEWEMPPQTVNAYYSAFRNEIVFPAGIMQDPVYNINNTRAENFGGIGMIIGHEITHAFDDNGSLYDENGNFNIWWKDDERKEFERLQQEIIEYYDNFELYDGNYIDGKLTLSENTADLGALQCITQIVGPDKNNLREMYQQYARCWAQVDTKEFMLNSLKTDVHSHARARVNAGLSSTDGFYYAFDIKKDDGMYVPKEQRVGIW